jgi:DNA-binding FrmR family transcriptional regulator
MINKETKENSLKRLNRIEGQIRGLKKMVEDEHYCIDLINQVDAVRRALEQVALIIMKRHIESCVTESVKTKGGKAKIEELIRTMDRFIR